MRLYSRKDQTRERDCALTLPNFLRRVLINGATKRRNLHMAAGKPRDPLSSATNMGSGCCRFEPQWPRKSCRHRKPPGSCSRPWCVATGPTQVSRLPHGSCSNSCCDAAPMANWTALVLPQAPSLLQVLGRKTRHHVPLCCATKRRSHSRACTLRARRLCGASTDQNSGQKA